MNMNVDLVAASTKVLPPSPFHVVYDFQVLARVPNIDITLFHTNFR